MEEKIFDNDYFTLTDEDGNEIEFELIGTAEIKGVLYYAMIPADAADKAQASDDGFCEYVILRAEKDENGEDSLVTIDDDEEFDKAEEYFNDLFFNEIDYDQN